MIRHSVKTNDGRTVNVGEGGDRRGRPVFALHGTPSSLILYPPHLADASKKRIRLISFDRAGYGRSSPGPGRKVADASDDVAAIADSLGLERFAVWGISGGGPHALACAALLPKRVVAAASLALPAPFPARGLDWFAGQGQDNVEEFEAALAGQENLERYLGSQRAQLLKATPEEIIQLWDRILPRMDKVALLGELGPFLASNMKSALRRGYAGWRDDDLSFVSDWGFDLSDISVPILLWQGRHDRMVPYEHGRWLARQLKGAEVRLMPDDGHLTLFERHIPETHAWLLKHF